MPADPNMFNNLLTNQAIQEAIKDPAKMKDYIANNKVLQQMIQQDPKLEQALMDPKLMSEIVTQENIDEANAEFSKRLLKGDEKISKGDIKDLGYKKQQEEKKKKEEQDAEDFAPLISEEEEMELRANYAFQLKQIKDAGIEDEQSVLLILKENKGDAQKTMEKINALRQAKK